MLKLPFKRIPAAILMALCILPVASAQTTYSAEQCETKRQEYAQWRASTPEAEQASAVVAGTAPEIPLECGHLVGLTFGGVVVSQQAEKLSQADPYLGFIVGYNSRERSMGRFRLRFQGVFQASGRAASAPAANGGDAAPPAGQQMPSYESFLASRRSFDTSVHFGWELKPLSQILGIAPYAEVGLNTMLDANELQQEDVSIEAGSTQNVTPSEAGRVRLNTGLSISSNDVKRFHELGFMGNIYNGDRRALFVQSMFAYGFYEAFDGLSPGHNTKHRVIARLRIFPKALDLRLGRAVDLVPMFGVDLNAGRGPDYLRIFTGFAINLKSTGL